jgi:hypothetical protein
MEMSEEGNEELRRRVTSLWTFSSPNINACKYAFNLIRCNILFFSSNNNMATRRTTYVSFLLSIDRNDHVFTSMFYIAFAYGKMMKVAALFYLHEVIHVLANFSL